MTTNELNTPRYECIQPYPKMGELKVSDILESLTSDERKFGALFNYVTLHPETKKATERFLFDQLLSAFPANFRPMHWSEGRSVEDMPEYVKGWGEVFHVKEWVTDAYGMVGRLHDYYVVLRPMRDPIEPATQTEYEAYQNSKAI